MRKKMKKWRERGTKKTEKETEVCKSSLNARHAFFNLQTLQRSLVRIPRLLILTALLPLLVPVVTLLAFMTGRRPVTVICVEKILLTLLTIPIMEVRCIRRAFPCLATLVPLLIPEIALFAFMTRGWTISVVGIIQLLFAFMTRTFVPKWFGCWTAVLSRT